MLNELLRLIASGRDRTQRQLAATLGISDLMVEQMIEQLASRGYLAETRQCAGGCGGCPVADACGPTKGLRFWSLTEKGLRALRETG